MALVPQLYVFVAVGFVALYAILSKVTVYVQGRRFAKAHGCLPAKAYPQSETIMGYNLYNEFKAASLGKRIGEANYERYQKMGTTYTFSVLGRYAVVTIDPENIKTVLATNFKDYGLGGRQKAFGPLLGHGIFTTDGAHWEHSRVCRFQHVQLHILTNDRHLSDPTLPELRLLIWTLLKAISST